MTLHVCVALALPDRQEVVALELPDGSTVGDALRHPGVAGLAPALAAGDAPVGIWSRPCGRETALRDGDRVEVYRPLKADPKESRRARARLKPSNRSRNAP